ncbi:MAG: pentapeptide repeat-containing protein [Spirochaetaceae bacterium]|nr:pentapeptide repeat-containing protein [Spirochaetaceae bacterium]
MANSEHIKWLLEGVKSWNRRRELHNFYPDLSGADIYEAFREAGSLNDDYAIPLSGINLTNSNLRDSRLCSLSHSAGDESRDAVDLSEAILTSTDFQSAQLVNSRFNRAKLYLTKFDSADMYRARLQDVKTMLTSFRGARLRGADLTGADMRGACFTNSDLSRSTLKGTDFTTVDLTGLDLSDSQPWQAKLFSESRSSVTPASHSGCERRITCVSDLIDQCAELEDLHSDNLLYLRGEHTNTWELRPTVMRSVQDSALSLRDKEGEMLLDLMSRRPDDFTRATSALAQWVLAQHHGLNTRLLDVSRNPLVALFAACESYTATGRLHVFSVPREIVKPFNSDTISILSSFAKLSRLDQETLIGWMREETEEQGQARHQYTYNLALGRLYRLIRQEKPDFEERVDPRDFFRVFVVEPQQSFERVRAQSGAFLISAFHEQFERCQILKWNPMIPVYEHSTLEVPKESKQHILNELRLLNISRETLYPGLDEAAKAATERAIGYLSSGGT